MEHRDPKLKIDTLKAKHSIIKISVPTPKFLSIFRTSTEQLFSFPSQQIKTL